MVFYRRFSKGQRSSNTDASSHARERGLGKESLSLLPSPSRTEQGCSTRVGAYELMGVDGRYDSYIKTSFLHYIGAGMGPWDAMLLLF